MKFLYKKTEEIKGKIVGDYANMFEIEIEVGGVMLVSKADIIIVEPEAELVKEQAEVRSRAV